MYIHTIIVVFAFFFVQHSESLSGIFQSDRQLANISVIRGHDISDLWNSIHIYSPTRYSQGNTSNKCDSFVRDFGEQSASFINCSVNNARPFRFCEGCVREYTRSMTVYHDITNNDEKHGNCRKLLLDADRVMVISSVQRDIDNIWKSADCAQCFDSVSEDQNGTVTYTLKGKTQEFLSTYQNFTECVTQMTANVTDNDRVCNVCRQYYRKMNSLFNSFLDDPSSPQHVCMDIVDMMNYTRLLWGGDLKCSRIHRSDTAVILVVSAFICIPIMFYIIVGFYGTKKTRKIMKQKRLATPNYGTLDSPPIFSEETERHSHGSALRVSHESSVNDNNHMQDRIFEGNGDLPHRRTSLP